MIGKFFLITLACLIALTSAQSCDGNPCLNGGTCTETSNVTYSCNCDSAYSGTNCENSAYTDVGYVKLLGTTYAPEIEGYVRISMINSSHSFIEYYVSGLMPLAMHGLHIHEWGDIFDIEGMYTGGHYNPTNTDHGCYPSPARHVGDLFNITADENGIAQGDHTRDLIHVVGDYSGIARAIIIHEMYDDCQEINGNAGLRYAQGVIGIANVDDNTAYSPMGLDIYKTKLYGTTGNEGVSVDVFLYWPDRTINEVWVYANSTGLPDGIYALHIHEFGDLSSDDASATGGHYNPTNEDHGLVDDADDTSPAHQGDIGNIVVTNGVGMILKTIPLRVTGDGTSPSTFTEAFEALAGRGFVLHADEDDGGQPTGNAGARLAQGVIGVPMDGYFPYYLFPFSSSSSTDPDTFIPGSTGGVNAGNSISPFTFFTFVIASICAYFLSR